MDNLNRLVRHMPNTRTTLNTVRAHPSVRRFVSAIGFVSLAIFAFGCGAQQTKSNGRSVESATKNRRYSEKKPPNKDNDDPNADTSPEDETPPAGLAGGKNFSALSNWTQYQSRNVIHIKLSDGFLQENDVISVSNRTTEKELLSNYLIKRGVTVANDYVSSSAIENFELQAYPSDHSRVGYFAFGPNTIDVDVRGNAQRKSHASLDIVLKDFDVFGVSNTVHGDQRQVSQGLQGMFVPIGYPTGAASARLRVGAFSIVNQ